MTQPIYVGVNEVTQVEYEKVMGVNPSHFAPMGIGKGAVAAMETTDYPVEMVSWNDAAEFSAKLSKQEKFKPFYFRAGETITPLDGTGYRLPSEAEWEFACRAGTTTKYWIGDKDEELMRAGWFVGNSGDRTHATGELKANPFGLSDIHGNVWEWVQDGWDATYYGQFQDKPAINPNSPFSAGSQRVVRGGYWYYLASGCRSSARNANDPARRGDAIGFRVSLVVDAVKAALAAATPPPATGKLFMHDPIFPQWMKDVQAMTAEKQLEAVSKKLVELNPGFDGKLSGPDASGTPLIVSGVVTDVHFSAAKVADLSPVRAFSGLKSLACSQGVFADLSPLNGMRLTSLFLVFSSQLSDLSPLRGMPLQVLNLHGTGVSDLSSLKGLPLTKLILIESPVADLTPLKGMPLTWLDCLSTRITDLSPLEGMPLTLLIGPPEISSLAPLKNMGLTHLEFNSSTLSDLSPLSELPLNTLGMIAPKVSDLKPLAGMKLTQLTILGSSVSDLTPLKGMPLKILVLSGQVSDLSPLKELPLEQLIGNFRIDGNTEILRSIKTLQKINDKPVAEFWKEVEVQQKGKKIDQ
ncbi:MAG: SUMF1/EgtB/PvdO family nonheme iron enzyme [Planctomycetota bacterium]